MSRKPTVAVIQFPGSNCEYETARMLSYMGCVPSILRWNDPLGVSSCDGVILPGGFSFQDRVRSGVMASHLPIMASVSQAIKQGKPAIGICNGCQILAESGLLTDTNDDQVQVGLAKNRGPAGEGIGFVCDWVYVKPINPALSPLTRYFDAADVLPIVTSHAEGRFEWGDGIQSQVSSHAHFVYCDANGVVGPFPVTPNGGKVAGVLSYQGRVLGIMPHPERAILGWQFPWALKHRYSSSPWEKLMVAFKELL